MRRERPHLPAVFHLLGNIVDARRAVCAAGSGGLCRTASRAGRGRVIHMARAGGERAKIVYAALDFYQKSGCGALIAIGGGSPIDVAKAVQERHRIEARTEACGDVGDDMLDVGGTAYALRDSDVRKAILAQTVNDEIGDDGLLAAVLFVPVADGIGGTCPCQRHRAQRS